MKTLTQIINETYITESQESKSQSEAIKLVMSKLGLSHDEADDWVRNELRQRVIALRDKTIAKFTLGVARMVLDGELDYEEDRMMLNKVLKLAATEKNINRFNRNLEYNGSPLSADEFISLFKKEVDTQAKAEREEMENTVYTSDDSDYDIILIDSFEAAEEYSAYTDWCITRDNSYFNRYMEGDGTFYFALKHGFEDIEREAGNKTPLDEYGLSMLAICVDSDGNLKTCTCRWNHANGGNDNVMTEGQISKVIKRNFHETFVPSEDVERGISEEEYRKMCDEDAVDVSPMKKPDGLSVRLSQDINRYGDDFFDYNYGLEDPDGADYFIYD